MNRLDGKISIITGASKGLGEANSRLFIGEGAKVILTDIDKEAGEALAAELGDNAEFIYQDVREEQGWQTLIDDVVARYGGLDVLVNNAGVVKPGTIESQTMDEYDFIMDVSTRATFMGCKYAIPAMTKSGGGSIINMASIASIQSIPRVAAYAAAKGAIQALTINVAGHCAENQLDIRCNCLNPSSIDTPMVQNIRAKFMQNAEEAAKLVPKGEIGEPNDVAHAVVFLASDESKFINGVNIPLDYGKSILPGLFKDAD